MREIGLKGARREAVLASGLDADSIVQAEVEDFADFGAKNSAFYEPFVLILQNVYFAKTGSGQT